MAYLQRCFAVSFRDGEKWDHLIYMCFGSKSSIHLVTHTMQPGSVDPVPCLPPFHPSTVGYKKARGLGETEPYAAALSKARGGLEAIQQTYGHKTPTGAPTTNNQQSTTAWKFDLKKWTWWKKGWIEKLWEINIHHHFPSWMSLGSRFFVLKNISIWIDLISYCWWRISCTSW